MDENVENNSQIPCEDELTLQRLLDEELDADASELVFHHQKGCLRCSEIFQELKELKALCESRLGREDEIEAQFSAAAMARVRSAIGIASQPHQSASPQLVSGNGTGQTASSVADESAPALIDASQTRIGSWLQSINFSALLQPKFVTALVALLIVAGLLYWLRPPTTVSAAQLLAKSAAADEAITSHADQVLRRTINLRTRVGQTANLSDASPTVISRRIEIWNSAEKGLTARRLFDERDHLLAGEWKKPDGSRLLYQEGAQPQLQSASDRQPAMLLSPSSVWLLNVSAKDFSALVGNVDSARVEQTEGTYVISYEAPNANANGLVKATLVLSKADLHTIEQTLVVESQESGVGSREFAGTLANSNQPSAIGHRQFIEYRFAETSFERRAPNTVAPAVFEPDAVVLSAMKGKDAAPTLKPETSTLATTPDTVAAAPPAVTAELEVDVLEKLNRANALQGEQLTLTRADGKLVVTGIVETTERKAEILRALGEIARNPAVRIDVNTVAEAQQRQKSQANANITIENVEVAENTLPVDAEVRGYLTRKGLTGQALESEIEQFSRRVLGHSARARSHALALKQIAERFSPADIEAMDDAARTRWRALITEHANAFRRELEEVRRQLAPMFPAANVGGGSTGVEISGDQDLARAARRLFELAAVTDNGLRRSLSLSSERSDAPVRSQQFWESFSSAENLATKISKQ